MNSIITGIWIVHVDVIGVCDQLKVDVGQVLPEEIVNTCSEMRQVFKVCYRDIDR